MEIKKIKVVVRKVLENVVECRDNDELLILKVWAIQNPELRKNMSFNSFAEGFLSGYYSHAGGIIRCRAKLQEENENLRGNNYKKRHKLQQKIINDLNN